MRNHGQILRPAIRENLPRACGLAHKDYKIFSALFAPHPHGDRNQHLATTDVHGDLTHHFQPQRLHLDVAQSRFQHRHKKLPNRGQAAHRRSTGSDKSRVGSIQFHQIVDVPYVAGMRPILDNLAGCNFGTASRSWACSTGSAAARRGAL